MKKVFLIGFSTPVLREAALELRRRGVEVLYWQGARDYFREEIMTDKENFPKTIFCKSGDIARCLFPAGFNIPDIGAAGEDVIKGLCNDESAIFSMIGRADVANSTFNLRKNRYYGYINFYNALLAKLQPDAVFFNSIPHSAVGHTLYSLAHLRGVATVVMDILTLCDRTIFMNDYRRGNLNLIDDLKKNAGRGRLEDLSDDIGEYYTNQLNPAIDSSPFYLKKALENRGYMRFPSLRKIFRHIIRLNFKVVGNYFKMFWSVGEFDDIAAAPTGWRMKLLTNKWQRLNRGFKREYEKLQVRPDFSKKFIYVPLHLQPEDNTCPMGGVFEDQLLMIDVIASSLPRDWVVFVKENPVQWTPNNVRSYLYRYKGFYEQMASRKNVFLVPINVSTYELLAKCQAVATVTGTAGWEALLRLKPALVFGYAWYRFCDGAFVVSDVKSCEAALEKIKAGYSPNSQKIIDFLAAVDRHTMRLGNYKTLHGGVGDKTILREVARLITDAFWANL